MKFHLKKILVILFLLILFVFISNYTYAKSEFRSLEALNIKQNEDSPEFQKIWWCNLFPSYAMTDWDNDTYSKDCNILSRKKAENTIKIQNNGIISLKMYCQSQSFMI